MPIGDTTEIEVDFQAPLLTRHELQKDEGFLSAAFRRWWDSCTLVALTSAMFVAVAALCFKLLTDHVSVFQILAFRSFVALPLLGSMGYYQSGCLFGPKDNILRLALRGFCAAMDFAVGGISVSFLPLSEAALLGNCHPAVFAILQWCLGMERSDRWTWLGVLGTLVGQILIARPPFLFGGGDEDWDAKRIIGIFFAFASSVFRSFGFLLVTRIDPDMPPIVIANYPQLVTLFVTIPFLFFGFPKTFDSRPSVTDILLYFGACSDNLNQILIIRSLQIGPAVKAAILSMSRVLMTMALGLIICSEKLTLLMAIGATVLLASITLVIVRKSTTRHPPASTADVPLVDGKD